MEYCSATKKNEIFFLQVNEWKNIIMSEVNQVEKAKAACFLSYMEYRLNTNTVIL
jgi:hypothetical protein